MNFLNFEEIIFGFRKKIYGIFADNLLFSTYFTLKTFYWRASFSLSLFRTTHLLILGKLPTHVIRATRLQKLQKFRENTGLESRNQEIMSTHCESKVWKLGRKYTVSGTFLHYFFSMEIKLKLLNIQNKEIKI